MIYLEMAGRLGNQMFRYSFARRLAMKSHKKLIIDFNRVYQKNNYKKTSGWENSLDLFQARNYFEERNNSKKEIFIKNATIKQLYYYYKFKIISKLLKNNKKLQKKFQIKMQPKMNQNNLFFLELGYYNYDLSHLNDTKVVYVCGCFECSKYFNEIQDEIRDNFKPIKSLEEKNKKLMKIIENNNSICITVRRGDFVTNAKNAKVYNICDVNYFEKAIEIMNFKVENPTYIIFSDDVNWVKENIDFKNSVFYSEDGTDSVDEKLRMMSNCKHFIISNSTFSWWAQYLSQNEKKIVVSPDRWYKTNMESDLIEDKWIKINTRDDSNEKK